MSPRTVSRCAVVVVLSAVALAGLGGTDAAAKALSARQAFARAKAQLRAIHAAGDRPGGKPLEVKYDHGRGMTARYYQADPLREVYRIERYKGFAVAKWDYWASKAKHFRLATYVQPVDPVRALIVTREDGTPRRWIVYDRVRGEAYDSRLEKGGQRMVHHVPPGLSPEMLARSFAVGPYTRLPFELKLRNGDPRDGYFDVDPAVGRIFARAGEAFWRRDFRFGNRIVGGFPREAWKAAP